MYTIGFELFQASSPTYESV